MYYFVNDHLGRPQKIADSAGQVVWTAAYLPFGKAQVKPETVTNNLRFPGQYYDAESGLHYNWHRYYDPDLGRYLTADPIGLAGGVNLYVYVMNNPVNRIDPYGLWKCKAGKKGCNPDDDMDKRLKCLDQCTGKEVNVTYAKGRHVDLGRGSNPSLCRKTMEKCLVVVQI